jgi:hypothetical protein
VLSPSEYVEVRLKAEKHWQNEALVCAGCKRPINDGASIRMLGQETPVHAQKSLIPGSSNWRERKRFLPIRSPFLPGATSAEGRQVDHHAGAKHGNVLGILPKVSSNESNIKAVQPQAIYIVQCDEVLATLQLEAFVSATWALTLWDAMRSRLDSCVC